MTDSQHHSVALHPMNQNPDTRGQHIPDNTIATAADLPYNSTPDNPQNSHLISSPLSLKSDTFWTFCNRCRIRYEFPKMYLNQQLLCHHCQQPFMAMEMSAQSTNVCNSPPCPALFASSKDSESVPTSSTRPTETATTVQPSSQNPNTGPQLAVNMARGDEDLEKNVTIPEKVDASSVFNVGSPRLEGEKSSITRVPAGSKSGRERMSANLKANFGAEEVVSSNSNRPRGSNELSLANICRMLMEKARTDIIRELNK